MSRSFNLNIFLPALASLLAVSCSEPPDEDIFCANFDTAYQEPRDYQLIEDLPLFLLLSLDHVNFSRDPETTLQMNDMCLYFAGEVFNDERIYVFKNQDLSGDYPILYEFRRAQQLEGSGFITLSAFASATGFSEETGLVPENVRVFHLEYYDDESITLYRVFAGDPPMEKLMELAVNIWFGDEEYIFIVEGSEDATITINEKYLEE